MQANKLKDARLDLQRGRIDADDDVCGDARLEGLSLCSYPGPYALHSTAADGKGCVRLG